MHNKINNLNLGFDWKKFANASMKEQEAELAFAKIANNVIQEKAGVMFRDPYLQGFEIVSTNNSFTRMIGIFVFRVDKNLFYAPVFYINGDLKGASLLYSVDEKLFTLLSPEWCEYYVNKVENEEAIPLNPSQADKGTQDLEMRWLAYPPYMAKGASTKLVRKSDYKAESPLSIFGLIKEAKEVLSKEDYFTACENWKNHNEEQKHLVRKMVKVGGYEMFDKLASMIENDFEFANNFVEFCDLDKDLLQKDVLADQKFKVMSAEATTKIASIKSKEIPEEVKKAPNQIRIYKGRFNPYTNKTAAEQIAYGYSIEDTRPEEKLEAVILNPEMQFSGFESGVGYGIYDMLTSGGDIKEVFMISGNSDGHKRPALIIDADDKGLIWYDNVNNKKNLLGKDQSGQPVVDVAPGDHTQEIPFSAILANRVLDNDYEKSKIEKFLKSKPEAGKIYGIFDSKFSYISDEAFYITDVQESENGGLTIAAFPIEGYRDMHLQNILFPANEITIRVNPEENNIHVDLKIFNPKTQWIEIPFKLHNLAKDLKDEFDSNSSMTSKPKDCMAIIRQQDYMPGTITSFYKLTRENNIKKASVKYFANYDNYVLSSDLHTKPVMMNKLASTVQLMHDFNYSQEDAEEILNSAKQNNYKPYDFFYKTAARIILNPDPKWYEGYDSDLGTSIEVPETRVLATQNFEEDAPAPRFGDHMPVLTDIVNKTTVPLEANRSTDNGDFLLRSGTPNMLAEVAKATGKSSLFEHGVVGSLAKVNDPSLMISEYLPDLYQGNDKLGRLIFLLYVSPQLFIEFYGSDDIDTLENSLLSIFKQQAELILELSKRTKTRQVNTTVIETSEK
jgi:hypothetical protein